jgi:hypothetical protein
MDTILKLAHFLLNKVTQSELPPSRRWQEVDCAIMVMLQSSFRPNHVCIYVPASRIDHECLP